MTVLDTALRATPAFFGPNLLNKHADRASDLIIANATAHALRHRLYDMDPRSPINTAGSDDATEETIEFGLWAPGMASSFNFDYFAMLNHNIKEMTVEYSNTNGAPWTELYNSAAIATTYTRVSSASLLAADRFRIRMLKTQVIADISTANTASAPSSSCPSPAAGPARRTSATSSPTPTATTTWSPATRTPAPWSPSISRRSATPHDLLLG